MQHDDHAERLSALETHMEHLREQHKAYAQETRESMRHLVHKVDGLSEMINRGKGAFAVSMLIAAAIGGSVVKGLGAFFIWMER